MIESFPDREVLTQHVRDALGEVAKLVEVNVWQRGGWTRAIATELDRRVIGPGIEPAWGHDRDRPADNREWLFDYCALSFEEKRTDVRRFMAQALIIGEIEFGAPNDLDRDFEKLLVTDSLVCFFAFPSWSKPDADQKLIFYGEIAERRLLYGERRGITQSSVFLLSSYLVPSRSFLHKVISLPSASTR